VDEQDAQSSLREPKQIWEPASLADRRTRLIAVANQKGGVGKSTTAVSVGAALAELGHRVLVVDLDPQGNASTGLGIRHDARQVTVYDVLAAEAPIDGAIVETPIANLLAIPSTIDLAGAEIELVSQFSRELRLRKALEPLKESEFDFVFLDCPPSLGLLTVNALGAAEELIVPIQCEYYALEGLGQLLRNVRLVQQNVNSRLRLTGIVMTMYDPRTKLSDQVVQEVRRYFGDRVYDTIIPRTVRLSEAPGYGLPITEYDPRSRGAQSYRELAAEVATKLPDEQPLPVIEDLPAVIVTPAEPEPARAPRPLVREADELGDAAGEGADEEERQGIERGSTPSVVLGREAPSDAEVEPEPERLTAKEDVQFAEVGTSAVRHEPPGEDEDSASSTDPAGLVSVPEPEPARASSEGEAKGVKGVTVIEDAAPVDAETEIEDAAAVEGKTEIEDAAPVEVETGSGERDGQRKRRWSPFRKGDRGGDR
jgi:chromosome partitioning protein